MKNPFRRQPNEVEQQIAALRDIAETMEEAARNVAMETSAPMLRKKLTELDPRLLDLLIDQSRREVIYGETDLSSGSRQRAVEATRWAMRDIQIKAAVRTWTAWGFGRKLEITAIDPEADAVWQECWTAPRNRPVFGQAVIHRLSNDILRDGEVFFVGYASRQDGEVTWRTFDTLQVEEIIHPDNDDTVNLWYIVTLDDRRVAIPDAFALFSLQDRYERAELPTGVVSINDTDDAEVNGGTYTVMVAAQRNRDKYGRGWPEFYDAIPWSNVYNQMLKEYSAVFSAVALYVDKLKVEGGARTVTDVVNRLQSSLVNGVALGGYDRNPPPAPGATWVENEAADRTRLPLGSAAGDAQAGTGILSMQLATALGVKTSDVGRVDMFQNRATADIAAQSPTQLWQQYQLFWASVWSDVVETTLRLRELFERRAFASYESRLTTSLPMDIDTADIATIMRSVNDAAAAMTLPYPVALRAQAALLVTALNDLGIEDIAEIFETPEAPAVEAEPVALTEDAGADQEPARDESEAAIQAAMLAVLADFEPEARQALATGEEPDYTALEAAIVAALLPLLWITARQRVEELMLAYNLFMDDAEIDAAVSAWANTRAAETAAKMTGYTRQLLDQAAAEDNADMAALLLARATGEARAENTGITETTFAISAGATIFIHFAHALFGLDVDEFWYTQRDERVCNVCRPLHQTNRAEWGAQFPDGPPAHNKCRCYKYTRIVKR